MKLQTLLRTGLVVICACLLSRSPLLSAEAGTQAVLSVSDSIEQLLKQPVPGNEEIATLNRLVEKQWERDPASKNLLEHAQRVLDLATASDNDLLQGDAHINLVRLHLTRYESALALKEALEALKIFQKYNHPEKTAYTLLQLGIIYYTQYDYKQSLKYYASAIKEYKKINNVRSLALR